MDTLIDSAITEMARMSSVYSELREDTYVFSLDSTARNKPGHGELWTAPRLASCPHSSSDVPDLRFRHSPKGNWKV